MQTFNQATHKDEPCDREKCDMCNQDEDICLEHLDPYYIMEGVELDEEDYERNKKAAQPVYKKIKYQI